MKNFKKNNGITLVALIITIVVLLILASVAISTITNDGIINHANNAATSYKNKANEEGNFLNGYESLLNKYYNS